MLGRNKILVGILYLTLSYFVIVLWMNLISMLVINAADKTPGYFHLTPFHLEDIWGAKIENSDKSRQFFAGIQRGNAAVSEGMNENISLVNSSPNEGKTRNYQQHYKFEFATFAVRIKVICYTRPDPDEKGNDRVVDPQLEHLNYIVKSSSCDKCNHDDMILVGKGTEQTPPISAFGILFRIEQK